MKIMQIILSFLLVLSLLACTKRIKKEDFEKNYPGLQIEEITPKQFFALRMRNRITKMAEYNYDIIKQTDSAVVIAKTWEKRGDGIYYSKILKCSKKELAEQFPYYASFDGIEANAIITDRTKIYEPKFHQHLNSDFASVPELTATDYVFHIKWNYSADDGPLVKRNYLIRIAKANLKDIKVSQVNP